MPQEKSSVPAPASIHIPDPPRGWRSRGYIPHFDGPVAIQHVTIHLADSLPQAVIERLDLELTKIPENERDAKRRKQLETWLDAGHGQCDLSQPSIASMMEEALLFFDGERYRLFAWVVMPNHVHVLFQPIAPWTLSRIVTSWKKWTAKHILDFRGGRADNSPSASDGRIIADHASPKSSGRIWHREYWDRFIRDDRHFQRVIGYIHENPVQAGLVQNAHQWRWSSVRFLAGDIHG